MPAAMPRTPPFDLRKAFALSVIVHLLLFMVHFSAPKSTTRYSAPLEVILVNAKSEHTPDKAKALAQVALDGGGQADKGRATTLPVDADDPVAQRQLNAAKARMQALEAIQSQLQGRGLTIDAVPDTNRQGQSDAGSDPKTQRELQIRKLQAQVAEEIKQYNERPRKYFFSPATAPYAFALYEEAWRLHVEQEGNSHYPEELRGKIYGKLRMTVYIRADGRLDDIEVDQSSGSSVLDRAAMDIVRRSSPFPPFPAEMRKKADILAITRTWVFSRDKVSTQF